MNPVWPNEPTGKQLAPVAGKRRFDIPAKSAKRSAGSRLTGRGHLFQRELLQRKAARPAGKPVEQVLCVDGDVAGGAEESGMPGNAAHATRGWIVDHSPEHDAMVVLRGRDAAAPASGGRNRMCSTPSGCAR